MNEPSRHIQRVAPEAVVDIEEDGTVSIIINEIVYLTLARLSEIVAFVEEHANVSVCTREHDE